MDEATRVLGLATRYARLGVRSTQEVRTYLRRRGAASALVARTLIACRARGLVDDRACARLWAEHWGRQGYAWVAIHAKLAAKGLADEAIAAARRAVGRDADDAARARSLVAQRARPGGHERRAGVRGRDRPREAARIARTLAARGFDTDVIERVLAESL